MEDEKTPLEVIQELRASAIPPRLDKYLAALERRLATEQTQQELPL